MEKDNQPSHHFQASLDLLSDDEVITIEDFKRFSEAKSYVEQLEIILEHAEKIKQRKE